MVLELKEKQNLTGSFPSQRSLFRVYTRKALLLRRAMRVLEQNSLCCILQELIPHKTIRKQ